MSYCEPADCITCGRTFGVWWSHPYCPDCRDKVTQKHRDRADFLMQVSTGFTVVAVALLVLLIVVLAAGW